MSNIERTNQVDNRTKGEIAVCDDILLFLFKTYDLDWQVGDLFWCATYGMGYFVGAEYQKPDGDLTNPYNISVFFNYYNKVAENPDSNSKYYSKYRYTLGEFMHYDSKPRKVESTEAEFDQDLEDLINGKVTMEAMVAKRFPEKEASAETGLMVMNKAVLMEKKRELVRKQQFMTSRAKAARELLDQRRRQLEAFAGTMAKFIGKLNRLIYQIELYLGLKEELVQFSVGIPAPAETPISFRQRRLYMDVEMGDPTDDLKGIDFKDIDTFDSWLAKDNPYWGKKNYELLIPEQKCVVIFKVRENDKDYGTKNPFLEFHLNKENNLTYVLIRNGENLYRIYGDITIGTKLFPDQQELTDLVNMMDGYEPTEADKKRYSARDKDDAEDRLERYKLNMILLQGIIERTPCFPDNAETTSIFSPEGYEGKINFVYDATLSKQLPPHTPTFFEWLAELNGDISEGNRILWVTSAFWQLHSYSGGSKRDEKADRLFKTKFTAGSYNIPDAPNTGLYTLHLDKTPASRFIGQDPVAKKNLYEDYIKETLFLKYNPGGEIAWSWGGNYDDDRTRKNNLSWAVYPSNDKCIINWDKISRRDMELMEFYLYTRIGREAYLGYIPMIMQVFKEKKKEIAIEDDFIKLALKMAGMNPELDFDEGIDAMEWWKLKNKWKRVLTVDDVKALRMIVKRLETDGSKQLSVF